MSSVFEDTLMLLLLLLLVFVDGEQHRGQACMSEDQGKEIGHAKHVAKFTKDL